MDDYKLLDALSQDFDRMRKKEFGADLLFKLNGQKYGVHLAILKERCPLFLERHGPSLGASCRKPKPPYVVKLPDDFEADLLEDLLIYAYTGRIRADDREAERLFDLATRYEVSDLAHKCEKKLIDGLDASNCARRFAWADCRGKQQLREAAKQTLLENVDQVLDTNFFEELCRSERYLHLLKEIIGELCPPKSQNPAEKEKPVEKETPTKEERIRERINKRKKRMIKEEKSAKEEGPDKPLPPMKC